MPEKRHLQSQQTADRVRRLREQATFPERLLWSRLRGRQLARMKFRRQHPIGPYIADFYCDASKLVVELDGISHDGRAQFDKRRTDFMESQQLRVMRVSNDDVLYDIESVLAGILLACGIDPDAGQRRAESGHPHPGPLPEAEGE